MGELQSVETLNMNIERTRTPPYYRLSSQKKLNANPNTTDDEKLVCQTDPGQLEKGVLHTKRHSANEDLPSEGWALQMIQNSIFYKNKSTNISCHDLYKC